MNLLQNELKRPTNLKRSSLWYSIGTMTFAVSSVFLLLVVTRLEGANSAGIFSIGWAVCQLMYTIGLFGTRSIQVSDLESRYPDKIFFQSKLVTIAAMLIGSLIYSWILHFSFEKYSISFLLTLLMSAETLGDVFSGFLQRRERLDLSGKSYFFRIITYDIVFLLFLVATHNMIAAIFAACVVSYLWLFLIDYQWVRMIGYLHIDFEFKTTVYLLRECFPIFISAFLTNYVVNIPKNSIELFLSNDLQATYNVLFMPSAIITLFLSFVLVPMYTQISSSWLYRDLSKFKKIVGRILFSITLLTIFFALAGYFIGIPILSVIYHLNLSSFKSQFVFLIIGGGINSLATFLVYILTVFKRQKILTYVYLVTAIFTTFISNTWVKMHGITGASFIYLVSISMIGIFLIIISLINYAKLKNKWQ